MMSPMMIAIATSIANATAHAIATSIADVCATAIVAKLGVAITSVLATSI